MSSTLIKLQDTISEMGRESASKVGTGTYLLTVKGSAVLTLLTQDVILFHKMRPPRDSDHP
jgi:hypothetical protein